MRIPSRITAGIIATILWLATPTALAAQLNAGDTLRAAVHEAPPFLTPTPTGEWGGLTVELLQMVAADLGVALDLRPANTLQEVLEQVQAGEVHLGAGALTITAEREEMIDFTHPYHVTGLGIAVASGDTSPWMAVARRFLSMSFLRLLMVWGGILLLIGFLIWFFERKSNPDFDEESAFRGVLEGFWFSAVTMTTVGYGDKAPRTLGGRLVSLLWMFAAVIMISSFTAAVATTLTVGEMTQGITGPDDLPGNRVGTVPLSTSARYLDERGVLSVPFDDVPTALEALQAGQVDAVVYDDPLLQYLVRANGLSDIQILGSTFETQHYGFALPEQSPIREVLNQALLRNVGSDTWRALLQARLGR